MMRTMIYGALLSVCLCAPGASGVAYAVIFPSGEARPVFSNDLMFSYRADITCIDNCDLPPEERAYQLTVRQKKTMDVMWSCDYDFHGETDSLLFSDGSVFVDVDPWYRSPDYPIIHVYRKGAKTFEFTPKYLGVSPDFDGAKGETGVETDGEAAGEEEGAIEGVSDVAGEEEGTGLSFSWVSWYRFEPDSATPILDVVTVDGRRFRINCLNGFFL